jgi:ubiquitin carboxyl-terminal hydrolase 10
MYGHEQAEFFESPITGIFGGKSHSTVRAPNQPDAVTVDDWRSLRLDIEVSSTFFFPLPWQLTSKLFTQPGSVQTIEGALSHVSRRRPVQVGQPSSSEASQQVLLEALPPVLVLHLERFLYDEAADGVVKIGKPVQIAPGLEISLGTIRSPLFFP